MGSLKSVKTYQRWIFSQVWETHQETGVTTTQLCSVSKHINQIEFSLLLVITVMRSNRCIQVKIPKITHRSCSSCVCSTLSISILILYCTCLGVESLPTARLVLLGSVFMKTRPAMNSPDLWRRAASVSSSDSDSTGVNLKYDRHNC